MIIWFRNFLILIISALSILVLMVSYLINLYSLDQVSSSLLLYLLLKLGNVIPLNYLNEG